MELASGAISVMENQQITYYGSVQQDTDPEEE